jgi:hypothetical protein
MRLVPTSCLALINVLSLNVKEITLGIMFQLENSLVNPTS